MQSFSRGVATSAASAAAPRGSAASSRYLCTSSRLSTSASTVTSGTSSSSAAAATLGNVNATTANACGDHDAFTGNRHTTGDRKRYPQNPITALAPRTAGDSLESRTVNEIDTADNAMLYVNPLCSKMDQMILKAPDTEKVLTYLVTHRGVFFVHNLVSALGQLATLKQTKVDTNQSLDAESGRLGLFSGANEVGGLSSSDPNNLTTQEQFRQLAAKTRNDVSGMMHFGQMVSNLGTKTALNMHFLLKDERYELLIRDLRNFLPSMDLEAMASVGRSLQELEHRFLPLFTAMLKELRGRPLESAPTDSILELLHTFLWAGYMDNANTTFFNKASEELTKRVETMSLPQIEETIQLYGRMDMYPVVLLRTLERELMRRVVVRKEGLLSGGRKGGELLAKLGRVEVVSEGGQGRGELEGKMSGHSLPSYNSSGLQSLKDLGAATEEHSHLPSVLHSHDRLQTLYSPILDTPAQIAQLAAGFSRHCQPHHDHILHVLANSLFVHFLQPLEKKQYRLSVNERKQLPHLFTCMQSFRRVALCFPEVNDAVIRVVSAECEVANHKRTSIKSLTVNQIAGMADTIAHFGGGDVVKIVSEGKKAEGKRMVQEFGSGNASSSSGSSLTNLNDSLVSSEADQIDPTSRREALKQELTEKSYLADMTHETQTRLLLQPLATYIERHVDSVTERGAIDSCFFLASTKMHVHNKYVLSLLFRKIGLGTEWENHKRKIFTLWFSHILQFPWIEQNLPKRCVIEGFRNWALNNVPALQKVSDEVAGLLKAHPQFQPPKKLDGSIDKQNAPKIERNFYVEETPYLLDVAVPSKRIGFVIRNEVSRNVVTYRRMGKKPEVIAVGDGERSAIGNSASPAAESDSSPAKTLARGRRARRKSTTVSASTDSTAKQEGAEENQEEQKNEEVENAENASAHTVTDEKASEETAETTSRAASASTASSAPNASTSEDSEAVISYMTHVPLGSTLLQRTHLRSRGWNLVVVPLRTWKLIKNEAEKDAFLKALIEGTA